MVVVVVVVWRWQGMIMEFGFVKREEGIERAKVSGKIQKKALSFGW